VIEEGARYSRWRIVLVVSVSKGRAMGEGSSRGGKKAKGTEGQTPLLGEVKIRGKNTQGIHVGNAATGHGYDVWIGRWA